MKLKGSSEINEEIKVVIDPIYKAAVQQVEQTAQLEKEAKEILKKNISVQEETYKAKLAARKERMRLQRSGISSGSNDNSFFGAMQHPMTSRNFRKPRAF